MAPPRASSVRFTVLRGGCMRPLLRDGDVVPVSTSAAGRGAGAGDIVCYRVGKRQFLHRVWWSEADAVWVKDDTAGVALHRVARRRLRGRLEDASPLRRGWGGLLYGLAASAVFRAARLLRGA